MGVVFCGGHAHPSGRLRIVPQGEPKAARYCRLALVGIANDRIRLQFGRGRPGWARRPGGRDTRDAAVHGQQLRRARHRPSLIGCKGKFHDESFDGRAAVTPNLWNPGMQGPAIYDHTTGHLDAVRALLRRKRRAISWYRMPIYIETSNVFLKSYWDLAAEFFPDTKVFHLIRNPLEVARSTANRETWLREQGRYRYYRGRDGHQYRWWTLTGLEPIYSSFDLSQLTLMQFHLIQWIEIENRAMEYLRRFDMHSRCLTLYGPQSLSYPEAAAAILDFVGVDRKGAALLPEVQNRTPGYETVLGEDELLQCREVVTALPAAYLEIFKHEPYAGQPWAPLLCNP